MVTVIEAVKAIDQFWLAKQAYAGSDTGVTIVEPISDLSVVGFSTASASFAEALDGQTANPADHADGDTLTVSEQELICTVKLPSFPDMPLGFRDGHKIKLSKKLDMMLGALEANCSHEYRVNLLSDGVIIHSELFTDINDGTTEEKVITLNEVDINPELMDYNKMELQITHRFIEVI